MGIAIPQVITPSKATGAQVIDGSLRFDDDIFNQLKRTPGTDGNKKTWTWSGWVKRAANLGSEQVIFGVSTAVNNYAQIYVDSSARLTLGVNTSSIGNNYIVSTRVLRDTGWYHIVAVFDSTDSTQADRLKLYVNGERITSFSSSSISLSQNTDSPINDDVQHVFSGKDPLSDSQYFDGHLSQCYLIDGQALTPDSFGFTDPLTNTWKPKKYTGTFGTNGFYLPMDGNSPIGQDQSGQGNDFTPVNFSDSVPLDHPNVSGARPTLNTTQGGTQAGVGVFGSSENKVITVTVASKTGGGNAYFFDGVERDSLALIRGTTIRFDTTDSSNDSHPFKLSSTNADSSGGTEYTDGVAYFINGGQKNGTQYVSQYSSHSSGFRGIKWTVPHNVSTTYYYCTVHSGMGEDGRLTSTTDETKADKFAWKCFFALPCVGPNKDLSSVINLKSGGKALTVSGASASSAETHFYNESIYFDGSNDNIKTESTSHFLSPAEYTLEGWINITSAPANNNGEIIFDTGSGNSDPELNVATFNNELQLYESLSNNTNWDGDVLQTGRWYHFAQVVQGSSASDSSAVHKIYIDGKLSLTNTINLSGRSASSIACIGSRTNDSVYGNFYLSDLRFYQIAKYTSNFVVPSTSPDVLPDTPSGVAGSSKLTKITDGAVAFDGSGDYLEATSSTDFAFGTGDFTLEAYIYATSLPNTNNRIFCSGAGGAGDRTNFQLMVGSAGYLEFDTTTIYQTSNGNIGTNKWHHVAATREGTSLRLFIDGRLSHTGTNSDDITENGGVTIGREFGYSSYFNGFISNARILKGTALYTDDFTVPAAPLTNVTNTELLCCQSPTSATAAAVPPSGSITANGNAAATNFNPFNTDINTVRGQETGYATLNPLAKANISLSDGNLALTHSGTTGNWQLVLSTIGMSSGKFYCEFLCQDADSVIGIAKGNHVIANDKYVGQDPGGYSYNGQNGQKLNNSSGSSYGSSYAAGDLIGIAFDGDNGTLRFYKNNVDQGQAFSGLTDEYFFAFSIRDTGYTHTVNFGQKPFKYSPPDGFQPLNAANVRPVKVISRPDHYVGITTWKGNATSGRIITGLNFNAKPDLIWIKNRGEDVDHTLFDSVRGFGANEELTPNDSYTEGETGVGKPNSNAWGYVNSNIRNGFVVNNGSSGQSLVNNNNIDYVAWCWKAGDTTVANNDGTIATQVRANTEAGFSIVTATVNQASGSLGHGLGKTPDMILSKSRTVAYDWNVMNRELGGSEIMRLNTNAAKQTSSNYFNSFNSSTFSVAGGNSANCSGDMVYYCWTNIPGLQKFGVYSGNSNANGSFVELGFRPALLWLKRTDSTGNWVILDSKRTPRNPANISAYADTATDANYSPGQDWADLLSNGFKLRATYGEVNVGSYIYAAWAEAPSVDLYGGGANAR